MDNALSPHEQLSSYISPLFIATLSTKWQHMVVVVPTAIAALAGALVTALQVMSRLMVDNTCLVAPL